MWAAIGSARPAHRPCAVPYERWRSMGDADPVRCSMPDGMLLPFVPGRRHRASVGRAFLGARFGLVQLPAVGVPQDSRCIALLRRLLLTKRAPCTSCTSRARRRSVPLVWSCLGGVGRACCLAQSDLGSAIVLGSIVLAVVFIAGVPHGPRSRGSAPLMGGLGALIFVMSLRLPPRALDRLHSTWPRHRRATRSISPGSTGRSMIGIADGGLAGVGHRCQPGQDGATCPWPIQRLHLRHHRRGTGSWSGSVAVLGSLRCCSRSSACRSRLARQRPVRACVLAGGVSVHGSCVQAIINVGGVAGHDAVDRAHPSLRLGFGGSIAARHDDGGGPPVERRAAGTSRCPAARSSAPMQLAGKRFHR